MPPLFDPRVDPAKRNREDRPMNSPRIAVFPGSFDPITYGHLDVIRRGAAIFDTLIVGVSRHTGEKKPLLPLKVRMNLICDLIRDLPNVRVEAFSGMTVDFVRQVGATIILRGIRTFADFEYEFQLALANRTMSGVETVFVMASAENAFIRSTLIKEAAALGGDISPFVPPSVVACLRERISSLPSSSVGLGGDEPPFPTKDGAGLTGKALE